MPLQDRMPRCCWWWHVIVPIPGSCPKGRLGRERNGSHAARGPQFASEDYPGNRLRSVFCRAMELGQDGAAVAAGRGDGGALAAGRVDVSRLLGDRGSAVPGLSQGSLLLELGPQSFEIGRSVLE